MRGFHTVTHRFQEVTRQQRVTVKCTGCSKDRTRTVTVTHTINPYNRNELGHVRSPEEVRQRVVAELAERVTEITGKTIVCKTCLAKEDAAKILSRAAVVECSSDPNTRPKGTSNSPAPTPGEGK